MVRTFVLHYHFVIMKENAGVKGLNKQTCSKACLASEYWCSLQAVVPALNHTVTSVSSTNTACWKKQ